MIPDAVVEEVRARADIVEIIGAQISLKRAGKDFRALCPFHHEKTPSFYVVPAKGFYKCFGCGESGDVFSFLMKHGGMSFNDAVRQVAQHVGVEIPEATPGRDAEDPNRPIYEAVAFAADHFQQLLWEAPEGERARRYLTARKISREAAERFGLGCAPDEWRALRTAAHHHDIPDEILLASGLIKESERSEEPYDRFRDRLMFPIADLGGRWVAFGGRTLARAAGGVPKYLNSPETPVYHKGRAFYGLNWSKGAIRREGAALVVEGYLDYLALAAAGIENVVAGLGTALTEDQSNLLARYTGKALLLYDSDPAGLRATFRSADALLAAGVHPLVVTLPVGEDPDSLVRQQGAAGVTPLLEAAVDVLERKLQILEERKYFEDIDGVRRALDRLLPTLRAVIDPALRDIYVDRVAQRTGVRRETLEGELTAGARSVRSAGWRSRGEAAPRHAPVRSARGGQGAWGAERRGAERAEERLLLTLLAREPRLRAAAQEVLSAEEVRDPVNREIFTAVITLEDEVPEPTSLGLSAAAESRLEELLTAPSSIVDSDTSFANSVADIKVGPLFLKLDALDRRLEREAPDRADALQDERRAVLEELQAVHKELRELGKDLGYKISRRYRKYSRSDRPGTPETPTLDE